MIHFAAMKRPRHLHVYTIAACTLALYMGAVFLGLHFHPGKLYSMYPSAPDARDWRLQSMDTLSPENASAVEYGKLLFTETPIYASAYTPSHIACSNCHLGAGTAPYTAPVIGSAQAYPKFSQRSGRMVTLEDRVQECMTRSENGRPLPHTSPEMHAMLAYIRWLSQPHAIEAKFRGRGLDTLRPLTPDPSRGAAIYAAQCAGCHGTNGEGEPYKFPPLWGPYAFNDGAGMDTIPKLAAFVHTAMPQNRKGILSPQDAFDVAGFLRQQPRPAYNHSNDRF
jgi:thiosulfate dehydrogenase